MEVSMDLHSQQQQQPTTAKTTWNRATQPSLFTSTTKTTTTMSSASMMMDGGGRGSNNIVSHNINSNSTSTPTITGGGGSSNTIESDFSDHFVVRPITGHVSRPLSVDSPSPVSPQQTTVVATDRESARKYYDSRLLSNLDIIGDQPAQIMGQMTLSDRFVGQKERLGEEKNKIIPTPTTTKKLLTPFQFGKRTNMTTTSGMEMTPLIEYKNGKQSSSRYLPSTFDSPIPGLAQQQHELCNMVVEEPHIGQEARNSILCPFTAVIMSPSSLIEEEEDDDEVVEEEEEEIEYEDTSPSSSDPSFNSSDSVEIPDTSSSTEVPDTPSSSSVSLSPSLTPPNPSIVMTTVVASTTLPTTTTMTTTNGTKMVTGQSQISQDSITTRRHPFGYCLKQSTMTTTTTAATTTAQRNVDKLRQAGGGPGTRQFNNKYKPNVYRNNKNVPSTFVPLASSGISLPTSYQSQYSSSRCQGNPRAASRGDAPGTTTTVAKTEEKIVEGFVKTNNTNNKNGYLNRMIRPNTVAEGQVSHNEKLTMINSMVKPALGTTSMFNSQQQQKQQRQAPVSAIVPHYHHYYQQQQHLQQQNEGIGQGHKLVGAKYFRNDLTSPLGNFHGPIRPFILLPSSSSSAAVASFEKNFDKDWIQQKQHHQDLVLHHHHSIFRTCQQKLSIPIHLVFDCLVNLRKVGEGVYGEVFKGYFRGLPDQRVYKIVPIEGSKIVNGEKQKKFEEVEPEIVIAQELNKLRQGFNGSYTDGHSKMLFTRICQGKYPTILVDQWKSWHRSYVSQNDVPEFDSSQLYTVFEFEYHGTDIESFKFKNAKQSTAVLLHVIHALAAAEAACEFEHRDLHWGNILVVKTREPFTTYTIQGTRKMVPNCGIKSTIIDYTISRLTSSSGRPIFTDLANDEDQFCGSEDYQFEIYRMMREENRNDWSTFCPKTNIFWAHYLVEKLINKGRYLDTTSPTHNLFRTKLYRIQNNLLKFSSCIDCVQRFLPSICRDLELEGM